MLWNPYAVRELLRLRGARRIDEPTRLLSIKDDMLTFEEAAEILQMTEEELLARVKSDRYPHVQFAGQYFFPAEDIDEIAIERERARQGDDPARPAVVPEFEFVGRIVHMFDTTGMTVDSIAEELDRDVDEVARILLHAGKEARAIDRRRRREKVYVFEELSPFQKGMVLAAAKQGTSYQDISRQLEIALPSVVAVVDEAWPETEEGERIAQVVAFDSGLEEDDERILISYVVDEGMHPAHVARENEVSLSVLKRIFKKHGVPYPAKVGRPSKEALAQNPSVPVGVMLIGGIALALGMWGIFSERGS